MNDDRAASINSLGNVPSSHLANRRRALYACLLLLPATLVGMWFLSRLTGSPGSMPFAIAVFTLQIFGAVLYFAVPPIIFRVVGNALWRGVDRVPLYSMATFVIAGAFSAWYFAEAWSYALRYQGHFVSSLLVYANVVTALLLGYVGIRNRIRPTFMSSVLFHWLMVAWITTYAFPYLGEVP